VTRRLRVTVGLVGLVGLSACERIVDLIGAPDGGINFGIDAGSLDVGSGAGPDDDAAPDDARTPPGDGGLDARPDAAPGSLDASFVGAVRTRT
jgi:hypothetical protein